MINQIINKLRNSSDGLNISNFINELSKTDERVSRDDVIKVIEKNFNTYVHYTPHNISQLMAEIGRLYNPKSIIDICSGIGNNLYYCDFGDTKTGVDNNADVIKLSKYLYPETEFIVNDSIEYNFKQRYDLIISSFPFGHFYRENARRGHLEKDFLIKSLELVDNKGTIICIVPENLLSAPYCEDIRKQIFDNYSLKAIISIPYGHFRYSNVGTSILVIRNCKDSEPIFMGEFNNNPMKTLDDFANRKGYFWVDKDKVKNRWNRNFFDPKYNEMVDYLSELPTKSVDELSEILRGYGPKRDEKKENGEYLILTGRNIRNDKIIPTERDKYIDDIESSRIEKAIPKPDDIIVSLIANDLKLYTYKSNDPKIIINQNMVLLRSKDGEYIKTYLNTPGGLKLFEKQAERKRTESIIPHLSINSLKQIQIPILPLDDLNHVSDSFIEKSDKPTLEHIKAVVSRVDASLTDTSNDDFQTFVKEILIKIDKNLITVNEKVDYIINVLSELKEEFNSIRKLPREEEERLFTLYNSIDKKLDNVVNNNKSDIEFHVRSIKRWFDYWEFLDEASKKFLPSAEYLFDQIFKIEGDDYSPFIIQYCRVLENELLKKLFESYHDYLLETNTNIKQLTEADFINKDSKANKFAKYVEKDKRLYTMGDMNWIISLTKPTGSTYKTSPLLQSFRSFILSYYEERVLEKEYLDKIKNISENYRNKAAHPYIMSLDTAKVCQVLVRDGLNYLFENKKF